MNHLLLLSACIDANSLMEAVVVVVVEPVRPLAWSPPVGVKNPA